MSSAEVYIGLGSNLGNARQQFSVACELLGAHRTVLARSSLHLTKPYGFSDQPDFTNAVIRVSTVLEPEALYAGMCAVELSLGKQFVRENGPRSIDLDLLFYGQLCGDFGVVTLPHKRAHERDFVLRPLLELSPDFMHPKSGITAVALLAALGETYHTGVVLPWGK